MQETISPEEFLKTHEITQSLRKLGVTDQELAKIQLTRRRGDFPFSLWNLEYPDSRSNLSPEALPLLKPYAALKYLMLEGPIPSADTQAAWDLISLVMSAPLLELGQQTKELQRARAQKPRGKVEHGGKTVRQIIERLFAKNPEAQLRDHWDSFLRRLDDEGLSPAIINDQVDPARDRITYQALAGTRTMGFRRFANIISEIRGNMKKSR
jgi:hypothetical protein